MVVLRHRLMPPLPVQSCKNILVLSTCVKTQKIFSEKFLKLFEATIENYLTDESNVFASSRMVGNAEVAPVDTVAPDAPSDTTEVGTPIKPQATTEDSTQQENTQQQETTETQQQANAE